MWPNEIQPLHYHLCVCVFGPAFKARTRINFLHSKWGHSDKARSKFQPSLCDYVHCPPSAIIWMWGGYGRNPLFVRARHVQRCVKKCPHFECVIHRFVLALNAGTNTLYTRVYIVSSLWMPGQVGGWCVCVWKISPELQSLFFLLQMISETTIEITVSKSRLSSITDESFGTIRQSVHK